MDMIVSTMNDLPGYTIDEALGEVTGLCEAAGAMGANALIAMRFDGDEVGQGYQELVAHGTAVRVTKL